MSKLPDRGWGQVKSYHQVIHRQKHWKGAIFELHTELSTLSTGLWIKNGGYLEHLCKYMFCIKRKKCRIEEKKRENTWLLYWQIIIKMAQKILNKIRPIV